MFGLSCLIPHLWSRDLGELGNKREEAVVGSTLRAGWELLATQGTDADSFGALVANAVTTGSSEGDH